METHRDERHEIDEVRARLAARFAHLPAAEVHSVVDAVHAELTGPVRDFVPVLVEHIARDRLARGGGAPKSRGVAAAG
jgi:hypothetical protein